MLDIVMALEWVRDNIAVFGGDPNKVTNDSSINGPIVIMYPNSVFKGSVGRCAGI